MTDLTIAHWAAIITGGLFGGGINLLALKVRDLKREVRDLRDERYVLRGEVSRLATRIVAANPDHAAAWSEPDAFSPLDLEDR